MSDRAGGRAVEYVTGLPVAEAGDRLRAAIERDAERGSAGADGTPPISGAVTTHHFDLRVVPTAGGRPAVMSGTLMEVDAGTAVHAVVDPPTTVAPAPDLRSRGFRVLVVVLLVCGVIVATIPPGTGDGIVFLISYIAPWVGGLSLFVILLGAASWQTHRPSGADDRARLERFLRAALPPVDLEAPES